MKGDWRVIGWRRLSAAAVGRPHWRYRLLAAIWISRAGFQVWDPFPIDDDLSKWPGTGLGLPNFMNRRITGGILN